MKSKYCSGVYIVLIVLLCGHEMGGMQEQQECKPPLNNPECFLLVTDAKSECVLLSGADHIAIRDKERMELEVEGAPGFMLWKIKYPKTFSASFKVTWHSVRACEDEIAMPEEFFDSTYQSLLVWLKGVENKYGARPTIKAVTQWSDCLLRQLSPAADGQIAKLIRLHEEHFHGEKYKKCCFPLESDRNNARAFVAAATALKKKSKALDNSPTPPKDEHSIEFDDFRNIEKDGCHCLLQ